MDEVAFPTTVHFGGAEFAVTYQEVPAWSWVRHEPTVPQDIREARWVAKTMVRLDPQRGLRPCQDSADEAMGSPVLGFGPTPAGAAEALAAKLQDYAEQVLAYQAQRSG